MEWKTRFVRGEAEAKSVGRWDGELGREAKNGIVNYPRHCKALGKARKCLKFIYF